MTLTDLNRRQMGDVQDHVEPVAEEVCERWPCAFVWGRSNGTSGQHPKGLALDFSILAWGNGPDDPGPADSDKGDDIAAYLWANRHRLNVWYIIWDRRIISTNPDSYAYGEWTPYPDADDQPHTDHVHVSHYAGRIYEPPPDDTEEPDMAISKAELAAMLDTRVDNLREFMARRTQGRISEENQARYGYSKGVYQAGSLAADASWRTRALKRSHNAFRGEVLELLAGLAAAVARPMSDAERARLVDDIAQRVELLIDDNADQAAEQFTEPMEVDPS